MHHRRLRVRLETERDLIEGTIQLPNEGYRSRLTDFLNAHDRDFLPVTEAVLERRDGSGPSERHDYLAVSVRHVVVGVELEHLGTFDATGEPPSEPLFVVSSPPPVADE